MNRIAVAALALLASVTSAFAASHGNPGAPNPCVRLLLDPGTSSKITKIDTYTSATAVCNRYGAGSNCTVATDFFAGSSGLTCTPEIEIYRWCVGQVTCRAHLHSGNLEGATFSISGTNQIQVTSQGLTWTSAAVTTGSPSISTLATNIVTAINSNSARPSLATMTSGSIAAESATVQGYPNVLTLNVTGGLPAGGLPWGAELCDYPQPTPTLADCKVSGGGNYTEFTNLQNMVNYSGTPRQLNNTTQNVASTADVAIYGLFVGAPTYLTTTCAGISGCIENVGAYWGQLTVGGTVTGTIYTGQELVGTRIAADTEITGYVSGGSVSTCASNPTACNGMTYGSYCTGSGCVNTVWTLTTAIGSIDQTVSNESIITYPASLIATVDTLVNGGNTYLDLDVSVNSFSPYYTSSTNYFSDVSGNVASQAELTSAYIPNGAWADSPGQDYPSYNNAIQTALALIVADGLPVPGSFQLTNSACHAASTINYSLGPNLFFSESDTLQAFTQAQPGQYPYYLGTLNGGPYCGTTPSVVNFPGAH